MRTKLRLMRVPMKYREAFICALANYRLSKYNDQQKMNYANRHIYNDYAHEYQDSELSWIMEELSRYCPNLVNEWEDIVKEHGYPE